MFHIHIKGETVLFESIQRHPTNGMLTLVWNNWPTTHYCQCPKGDQRGSSLISTWPYLFLPESKPRPKCQIFLIPHPLYAVLFFSCGVANSERDKEMKRWLFTSEGLAHMRGTIFTYCSKLWGNLSFKSNFFCTQYLTIMYQNNWWVLLQCTIAWKVSWSFLFLSYQVSVCAHSEAIMCPMHTSDRTSIQIKCTNNWANHCSGCGNDLTWSYLKIFLF